MKGIIIAGIILLTMTSLATVSVYAAFPIQYDSNLDISKRAAFDLLDGNNLLISIEKTAKPMRPFKIKFVFQKYSDIAGLHLTTNMEMNMGNFQYTPNNLGNGVFAATLTLPKCGSGEALWYGKLDITYQSGKTETQYFFYHLN